MNKITTLKLNKDFKRLYYRGKSLVHPMLVTYAQKNRSGVTRIGITAAKKLGSAVCRNRCKRVIREAYRQLEPSVPQGWDFVFVARMKTISAKSTQLYPVMKKQIENLTTSNQLEQGKKKGRKKENREARK